MGLLCNPDRDSPQLRNCICDFKADDGMLVRRFDTLMRYNTVLVKQRSCCHDWFSPRLQPGVHYLVSAPTC
jgi:hypothetical protein